jgi:5-formyltetrahydrofolate cyclo-ligase
MLKKEIRKLFLSKRTELSADTYYHLNQSIKNTLIRQFDWSMYRYVHTFLPIESRREIDTRLIIEFWQKEFPQLKIVVPQTDFSTLTLKHFCLESWEQLEVNDWGIPEPSDGEEVSPDELDVVLVPLLAFDVRGYRVGYGKGFYDRFLSSCRTDALKIGLSMFPPVEIITDIHSGDVRLDACIVKDELIQFE